MMTADSPLEHHHESKHFHVSDLLPKPPRNLITASESTTVENVFLLLGSQNITAVPICRSDDPNQFEAMVSTLDLLHYMSYGVPIHSDDAVSDAPSRLIQPVSVVIEESPAMTHQLSYFSESEPLETVLDAFAHGSHRGIVRERNCMISQYDLVKFAYRHHPLTAHAEFVTAHDIIYNAIPTAGNVNGDKYRKSLVEISNASHAITGFKKLCIHQVESVAVVNEGGKMVACLAASDLKHVPFDKIDLVNQPVLLFLQAIYKSVPEPIVAHESTPFAALLRRMVQFNSHRVWIIDENDHPIGVVTMTDVAAVLLL
eukprot:Partr_v1_DN28558_c0_g2_i2_m72717